MRSVRGILCALVLSGFFSLSMAIQAQAACKTLKASHNGTDMFHETGAVGAAINKLLYKVNQLKSEHPKRRVRMGRVRTKCGPWFNKYFLPHRHCVAQARVCY